LKNIILKKGYIVYFKIENEIGKIIDSIM